MKKLFAIVVAALVTSVAHAGVILSAVSQVNGPVTVDIDTPTDDFQFVSSTAVPGVYKLTQVAGPASFNLLAALNGTTTVSFTSAGNGHLGDVSWNPVSGVVKVMPDPAFTTTTANQFWLDFLTSGYDLDVVLETSDTQWTRFNRVFTTVGFNPAAPLTWLSIQDAYSAHPDMMRTGSAGGADFRNITGAEFYVPALQLSAFTEQHVPEPAMLSVVGLAMLAVSVFKRRK